MINLFRNHDAGIFVEIPVERRGRLFVSPMPYGPYDRLNRVMRCYRRAHVAHVVPLVTDAEIEAKCGRNLLAAYEVAGIEVTRFPILDMTAPVCDRINDVVSVIADTLKHGDNVAVHCNAGVGRTGVVVACTCCRLFDCSGEKALAFIAKHMHVNLTDEQCRFVLKWREVVPRIHQ